MSGVYVRASRVYVLTSGAYVRASRVYVLTRGAYVYVSGAYVRVSGALIFFRSVFSEERHHSCSLLPLCRDSAPV